MTWTFVPITAIQALEKACAQSVVIARTFSHDSGSKLKSFVITGMMASLLSDFNNAWQMGAPSPRES